MPQIFSKIGNLFLWSIVSTFFISGTNLDDEPSSIVYNASDYTIQITGNLNYSLTGKVDFETSIVTSSKGAKFSAGTYSVSNNQEGLLNYFEGVFGFANINVLGELPLFAKSGEIQIDYLGDTKVKGAIRIQMSNAIGKSIQIKGSFIANK